MFSKVDLLKELKKTSISDQEKKNIDFLSKRIGIYKGKIFTDSQIEEVAKNYNLGVGFSYREDLEFVLQGNSENVQEVISDIQTFEIAHDLRRVTRIRGSRRENGNFDRYGNLADTLDDEYPEPMLHDNLSNRYERNAYIKNYGLIFVGTGGNLHGSKGKVTLTSTPTFVFYRVGSIGGTTLYYLVSSFNCDKVTTLRKYYDYLSSPLYSSLFYIVLNFLLLLVFWKFQLLNPFGILTSTLTFSICISNLTYSLNPSTFKFFEEKHEIPNNREVEDIMKGCVLAEPIRPSNDIKKLNYLDSSLTNKSGRPIPVRTYSKWN